MNMIKKYGIPAVIVVCVLILILSLTVCGKVKVENVVLDKTAATIKVEETLQLIGTVVPNNATESTISWQSSASSVATVSATGLVTGVGEGTCTITASAGGKVAICVVTGKKKAPDLKEIYKKFCDGKNWADIATDGSYLDIDDNPYDYDDYYISAADTAIQLINAEMGLPASLYNDMIQTTWSMGKQEEIYESVGIKVTWTYHPDKGLEVTYKLLNM